MKLGCSDFVNKCMVQTFKAQGKQKALKIKFAQRSIIKDAITNKPQSTC